MVTAEYYFMDMFLQYTVVLLLVTFWSCMTAGEVTLVDRNVTDSFRVGKDGCTRGIVIAQITQHVSLTVVCVCVVIVNLIFYILMDLPVQITNV